MNTINLETYKVETGLFPEITNEDNDDSISIPYPEEIVRAWYKEEDPGQYINGCEYAEDPCEEWIKNYYMISDITELYRYAEGHGCVFVRHNTANWEWITVEQKKEVKPMTPTQIKVKDVGTTTQIKVKDVRTITLNGGALWERIELEVGNALGKVYEELGIPDGDFNFDYEDEWHEAISELEKIFEGCISYNLNKDDTEIFWEY